MNHDLKNLDVLTQELRLFNEKICVVEINIKIANENEGIDLKTRKIQSTILLIQQRYGELMRNTSISGTITQRNAKIYQTYTS